MVFIEQEGASTVKALVFGAPISHNEAAWPGTQCPIRKLNAALTGPRKRYSGSWVQRLPGTRPLSDAAIWWQHGGTVLGRAVSFGAKEPQNCSPFFRKVWVRLEKREE